MNDEEKKTEIRVIYSNGQKIELEVRSVAKSTEFGKPNVYEVVKVRREGE